MAFKRLCIGLGIAILLFPGSAQAEQLCSYPIDMDATHAGKYFDAGFKGKVVETTRFPNWLHTIFTLLGDEPPLITTVFEVEKVYKGDIGKTFTGYQERSSDFWNTYNTFTEGEEVAVFFRLPERDKLYINCALVMHIAKQDSKTDTKDYIPQFGLYSIRDNLRSLPAGTMRVFEEYLAKLALIDAKIKEQPTPELYAEKIALAKSYSDYARIRDTVAAMLEPAAATPSGAAQKCTGPYAWKEGMAGFLANPPADKAELILLYGQSLVELKNFDASLRPLCLANAIEPTQAARRLLTKSRFMLGRYGEINAKNADFTDIRMAYNERTGRDGSGGIFKGKDFRNTPFQGAYMHWPVMGDTDFSGADFSGSALIGMKTKNVTFKNASFRKATVIGDFYNTDFSGSDFTGAKVTIDTSDGVSFAGANFKDAVVEVVTRRGGSYLATHGTIDFSGADFTGAFIRGFGKTNTKGANFTRVTFLSKDPPTDETTMKFVGQTPLDNTGLDLSNLDLKGLGAAYVDLGRVNFSNSDLSNAHFERTVLRGADFKGANLTGASFTHGADLGGADLSTAQIEKTDFTGAKYDEKTLFPAGFNPAGKLMSGPAGKPAAAVVDYSLAHYLSPPDRHYRLSYPKLAIDGDTDFSGSNFEGRYNLSFRNVKLHNTNFRHARGEIIFEGADMEGADFSYAYLTNMRAGWAEDIDNSGNPIKKLPSNVTGAKFHCSHINKTIADMKGFDKADLTAAIYSTFVELGQPGWFHAFNPFQRKIVFYNMPEMIAKYGPADYSNMDFSGCNLENVDFGTADLSGANFRGANLMSTILKNAKLDNADFRGALTHDYNPEYRLPPGLMEKAEFLYRLPVTDNMLGKIENVLAGGKPPYKVPDLSNENFDYVDWSNTWLVQANLQNSSLRFAFMSGVRLGGANMKKTDLRGAVLSRSLSVKADFSGANMEGADLRSALLGGAVFEGANLKNALYDMHTEWPQGFDPKAAGAYLVEGAKEMLYGE